VNRIFFGDGLPGIQRAATVYFGERASRLTPLESAMLAGVMPQPLALFSVSELGRGERGGRMMC